MIWQLTVLILLIVLSAFFSSAEFAFVVANKIKFEIKARKNNLAGKTALYFFNSSQMFFSTILIGNNIVNITFASVITLFLGYYFHLSDLGILFISTSVLLFFGELLPKYLAREMADRVLMVTIVPVRAVSFILYPVVRLTSLVSKFFSRGENLREESINMLFSREEIQMLVKESQEAGLVNESETDILTRIIELGDQRVYEVMRPRTDIVGVEISSTLDEVLQVFIESGYSKIPVYEENLDNIKGVVLAYDLFKNPQNLAAVMRPVIFVPDTKKSTEMLREFSTKRVSFAVAVDEFGGTAGILTMEDIIEELLGEIRDEYDTDDEICRNVGENTYLIGGKVEIDYINDQLNLNIPEGSYATIGGYITSHIGRIPQQGENLTIERYKILIIRSTNKRIELVRVTVITEEE
ncbi:MAG: HlyC/CorC family transporter [Ignavibacteria bacterium]|jgi:CBS domain containing-hemolysin-like protein|nr:HlyC/CorC family transporter [Ignavibacteria bacterium]MCU7497905.1 HlyC/CorC family transporter [Ignavibacteria bacterium]MCU7511186.1 HlyC/CorC family transporter [Ignavibacteria bacterium]MCU7518732.1 HlyC/CorC family transporter [Ignavibacteria bacterium]MCU7522865.1 HlyC/CorC family transporter [Ignavibacteria bacterium]